ncbi:hypothetical protein DTO207G8_7921 [Paecilomyces variotii]|nr:hypothetical protein DTO207G8_7921 [Paecilomyces variotii]
MGRSDDISSIQSTLSDLEQRASALESKISVGDTGPKNGPVDKHIRIALVGPPGSGKSTQATKLKNKFCICHLPIGQVLRSQISRGTPGVKSARDVMGHSSLVTDETMIDLIRDEINNNKECKNGFVLDDFPRNLTEARLLDQMLESQNQRLHHAIELGVSDTGLLESRITGRLTHLASGRLYHTIFHPPKEYMKDDITGEPLVHRPDDTVRNMRDRLNIYRERMTLIPDYYKRKGIWREVDGSQGEGQVFNSILREIEREGS